MWAPYFLDMIRASRVILSYSDILKLTTQEKIMQYYLQIPIDLNRLYVSPLRKDKYPTCSFYYTPAGSLKFHDFGTEEQYSPVDIVMALKNVNYGKALKVILDDLPLINKGEVDVVPKQDITLYYSTVDPTPYQWYWDQYGISSFTLKKFNVEAGGKVYRNDKLYLYTTRDNPLFIYNFPSGNIKIYRPLSKDKKKKWYGNSNGQDIGGYLQLNSTGSICLITSSMKDVMVLHEFGIPAICLNGEGYGKHGDTKVTLSKLINNLSKRFRYIFFFMNNDEAGMKFNSELSRAHHISYVYIPTNYPKDISDYVQRFGRAKTWKLIKKLIKNKVKLRYDELPY